MFIEGNNGEEDNKSVLTTSGPVFSSCVPHTWRLFLYKPPMDSSQTRGASFSAHVSRPQYSANPPERGPNIISKSSKGRGITGGEKKHQMDEVQPRRVSLSPGNAPEMKCDPKNQVTQEEKIYRTGKNNHSSSIKRRSCSTETALSFSSSLKKKKKRIIRDEEPEKSSSSFLLFKLQRKEFEWMWRKSSIYILEATSAVHSN